MGGVVFGFVQNRLVHDPWSEFCHSNYGPPDFSTWLIRIWPFVLTLSNVCKQKGANGLLGE